MTKPLKPRCVGPCGRTPDEIPEFSADETGGKRTPDEHVQHVYGYNFDNGHFLCPEDYAAAGSPTAPEGWVAP